MAVYSALFNVPEPGDAHYSERDLGLFVHTHDEMRQYRDHLVEAYNVEYAYNLIMHPLTRTLRNVIRDEYEYPYANLSLHVAELSHEALMVGSNIALAEVVGDDSHIRRTERELVHEIAGTGGYALPAFADELDAVDRARRLYAIFAALMAEKWIPAVPRVGEILAREFGGNVLLPRFERPNDSIEIRLALKCILTKYGPDEAEEALEAIEEVLPPAPDVWEMEPTMLEISQAVIDAYAGDVEGDAMMERIVAEIRPELDAYRDPRGRFYQEHCELIPGFDEDMLARMLSYRPRRVFPYIREWLRAGIACGHPVDPDAFHPGALEEEEASS